MWRLLAVGLMGLAIWAVNVLLPTSRDEEQLRSLTSIAVQGSDAPLASNSPSLANSLPIQPVAATTARTDAQNWLPAAETAAIETDTAKTVPAPGDGPVATTSTKPLLAPSPPTQLMAGLPTADTEESPAKLVSKLQAQLRRVGCYKGATDGNWNANTRRAMARFNDRINAQIDLDAASPALLTLVETYGNRACGRPCLPGTLPNAAGVCITPETTIAAATPVTAATLSAVAAGASNTASESATLGTGAGFQSEPAATPMMIGGDAQTPSQPEQPSQTAAPANLAEAEKGAGVPKVATTPTAQTVIAARTPSSSSTHILSAANDWSPTIFAEPMASGVSAPQPLVVAQARAVTRPQSLAKKDVTLQLMAPSTDVAVIATPALADVTAAPAQTAIVVLSASHAKKKRARKSTGWGGGNQVAFGGQTTPRKRSSGNWSSVFNPGTIILSRRFTGSSGASGVLSSAGYAVVLSRR